jgi:hypothetical protein
MKQIQMFLLLAVFISTVAVSSQQAASRGNAPADIVYTEPGQLVDADGFRLNLYCMGSDFAHGGLRFRMERLGARVVEGAAGDRQMDARLQL